MINAYWPIVAMFLLASCSGPNWMGDKSVANSRQLASIGASQLAFSDKEGLDEMLDERIQSLHSYYLIGQKNLRTFDEQIDHQKLEKLYESEAYLNLIAVRIQAEEIETELADVWKELNSNKKSGPYLKLRMSQKILDFHDNSHYSALSMENLMHKIELQPKKNKNKDNSKLVKKSLESELKAMDNSMEFAVYEKNVEHISHMLDIKAEGQEKKFYPSASKAGNIFGTEFPAKVWSLTFDDGPNSSSSKTILNNLKERELKATFFQLTKAVLANPKTANEIREAGMEIASHSFSHPNLTTVGAATLEKEITKAMNELKNFHNAQALKAIKAQPDTDPDRQTKIDNFKDINIKFFRLPYGAGLNSTHIREKIAENNAIHVFWSIDTLDWMVQDDKSLLNRTLKLMKKSSTDSGIILFHDIHARTARVSVEIMDYLKKDGRRVCTLDEIVTQINQGAKTVCPSK